jgi:hypothetical protein
MSARPVGPLLALPLAALLLAGTSMTVSAQEASRSAGPVTSPGPLRALDLSPFETLIEALPPERRAELDKLLVEATFADMQASMEAGELTSVELTTWYLARIAEQDVAGFQSMNELNPEALTIAAALDEERAAGNVRGPLHGIPLSINDNIGTGDQMHNAGAAGLEAAGAEVVLVWGTAPDNNAEFFQVGHNGFRLGLADYLAVTDPSPVRRSLPPLARAVDWSLPLSYCVRHEAFVRSALGLCPTGIGARIRASGRARGAEQE